MSAARQIYPLKKQSLEERLITVASGKGGVGKTWFSITLAHALTINAAKVLIFDGDLGLANIDIQLGLTPEKDISHVIGGEFSLKDIIVRQSISSQDDDGYDVIAGRSGSGNMGSLHHHVVTALRESLIELADNYDHLILDLGAGIDTNVMLLAHHRGQNIVVVSTEPTSLTDAYAFIKLRRMRDPSARIEIVVNNAASKKDADRIFDTLKKACQNFLGFTPGLLGIIRHDRHVTDSIRAQMPILTRFQNSPASEDVMAIAKRLQ